MSTSTTYPNGQVLTTTALTPQQVSALLQTVTCGMLGVNPPDYGRVRVNWQTQGQPFENVNADVCYVSAVPLDVEYNRVRDRSWAGASVTSTETWVFTRGWRFAWVFYGPNGSADAQRVWDATFIDYFTDALAASNLYPLSDPPAPMRVPEQFNAQWWERADFHLDLYEQVTETIQYGVASSVEVKVYDGSPNDPVADITVG